MLYPDGSPFHGEFASADASALNEANSRTTLYGFLSTSGLTLDANDIVQVTDIVIGSGGTNLTLTVYDGSDNSPDAGEIIWKGVVPTNSTIIFQPRQKHICAKGTYPKVKASGSGQIYVQIRGEIVRIGS